MDKEKLKEHILKVFENKKDRQIVFWYDNGGENESALDGLCFDNIKIHKLTKTNLFTKKLLEYDDLTSNYLIYADFEKPEPKENWFLDTQFYSREFSVDAKLFENRVVTDIKLLTAIWQEEFITHLLEIIM